MTAGIKERLAVRAVIEEKGLIVAALAEVTAQKRQNAVFRFDLPAQDAAQIGKAHKALENMGLALQVAHGPEHRIDSRMGTVPQKARAFFQQGGHQI